jgi:3-(3-hydroxy-phenyl)propionate hydroxylase
MKASHEQASLHYDVVIVGYGPTGATLAHLLSLYDLKILVLDKEKEMYSLPRAVHFDDETMRIFQTICVADQLCPTLHINPGMKFINQQDHLLLDWPRPQEISTQGWNASYRFHQPDLERILRNSLQDKPTVTIRTGCRVTDVSQTAQNVTAHFIDRENGQSQFITSDYIVGCDGANSLVRQRLGSDLEDLGFCQKWLVVDMLLKEDMPQLGDHSVQFCDPVRPMTYCRNPKNRRRWEIATVDGEADEDLLKVENIWSLLSKWITPQKADIERTAIYTFRSVVAKRWHRGRLLIAGDAAHLTPPFMGQGMCAGIRDTANLAWKLALRLKNEVGDEILQSYAQERIPRVRAYITTAARLGELIYSDDPLSALIAINGEGARHGEMKSISPALGEADFFKFFTRTTKAAGQLLEQPFLRNGFRMDDENGYNAVLISREMPQYDAFPVLSVELEKSVLPLLDKLGVHSVLLRPDRYVLATAKDANETKELCDLVSHTFGSGFKTH